MHTKDSNQIWSSCNLLTTQKVKQNNIIVMIVLYYYYYLYVFSWLESIDRLKAASARLWTCVVRIKPV